MAEEQVIRKLAAIFYADVAGYSRLTGADEEGTHRLVSAYLDAITASIQSHNGTALHFAGDAVLAEFPTVSDALICAVNVQNDLKERNGDLPDDRKVQFRIGVNLGEVIVDRGEIFGNGVNVAARLEALAEPGGICISASVYDAVGSKLPLDYEDMGEQSVRNIAKPVRAFAVRLKPDAVMPPPGVLKTDETGWSTRKRVAAAGAVLLLIVGAGLMTAGTGFIDWFVPKPQQTAAMVKTDPEPVSRACEITLEKPTIAVLPFTNLSDDPKQEYLSDGITEDIITRLARRSDMIVTARTSSFAFKGKSLTVPEIARKLNVKYILEGSVQKAGDRIRITNQLIDTETGNHLWAERYDRDVKDLFAVQDEIAHRVSVELAVELTVGDTALINLSSTDNFLAYDYFLQGMGAYETWNKESNESARKLLEKAIELDPQYARAIAMLGWVYMARHYQRAWRYSPEQSMKHAEEFAAKALSIDENDATAHSLLSWIYAYKRQYDQAIAEGKRAVALQPNDTLQHNRLAMTLQFAGQLDEATEVITQALCRGPYPPLALLSTEAFNHYLSGRYEQTIAVSRQLLEKQRGRRPVSMRRIIVSLMALGREAEARSEAEKFNEYWMKLRGKPYSVKGRVRALKRRPFKDLSWIDVYAERLRKAGVPD